MSTVQSQVQDGSVSDSTTNNNGGVGKNVGSSSTVLSNRGFFAGEKTVFASTALDNDTADEANSAGTFGFNNQRGVIRRVTSSLSDVSNDILVAGAAVPSNIQSINQISGTVVTDLTSAIRNGRWNAFSGSFDPVLSGVSADFGADDAANPTKDDPGSLRFLHGTKVPTTGSYSPKNT